MASKTLAQRPAEPRLAAQPRPSCSPQVSAGVGDLMDDATNLVQLTFWIEEARRSLGGLETFKSHHPELEAKLHSCGVVSTFWLEEQSEGLLQIHNLLLSKFRRAQDEVASDRGVAALAQAADVPSHG